MANTFELIEAFTVGSGGASSIVFSAIPSTYTDLVVKMSARSTSTADWVGLSFNTTTTGYSQKHMQGSGSTVASFATTDYQFAFINNQTGSTANVFSSSEAYIPNYRSSTNKSYSIDTTGESNSSTAYAEFSAQLWSNTAAITSITLTSTGGNLAQYTTAYLYGVKNA